MVFSSLLFIFGFLPIFLTCYYAVPSRFRNIIALSGSYFFYAWGEPVFVFALLFLSFVDYCLSRIMSRFSEEGKKGRKMVLAISLIVNIGCLLYFKYANFFMEQVNGVLAEPLPWTRIALPLGISFFTFQKLSYIIDIYRGTVRPARSFISYALYVALFPQLIAGPIVRYHDIAQQLERRSYTIRKFTEGIWRFSIGLGKKVLIANIVGQVADTAFSSNISKLPILYAWLGIISYSFQIYFDFSGYSDMAIGLGWMMGFQFLENFNRPYISRNVTEFWRRWHISLSNWMKEYLYIPLGGNRCGKIHVYLNLWIVFLISGFWHGADWTFIAWGAFHGFFLTIDRLPRPDLLKRTPVSFSRFATFIIVTIGWVLFRSDSISQAFQYFGRMISINSVGVYSLPEGWYNILDIRTMLTLIIAGFISLVPDSKRLSNAVIQQPAIYNRTLSIKYATAAVLILLSVSSLTNMDFNPFIYFRF